MTPSLRWLKWIAPILIVMRIALWAFGVSEVGRLAVAIVAVESTLTVVVLARALALLRASRQHAGAEDTWLDHVDAAFFGLFPDRIAQLASSEVRVFGTLIGWAVTKVRRTPSVGYPYNRHQMLIGWVMLFALSSPAEIVLLHILIPWEPVKWAVLAVELYGLAWLAAIGISFGFLRHTVSPDQVRLRQGLLADVRIPRAAILDVRREPTRSADGRSNIVIDGDGAIISMEGRTDLTLGLAEPVRVRRLFGFSPPVSLIRFAVDDPASFLLALDAPTTQRLDAVKDVAGAVR